LTSTIFAPIFAPPDFSSDYSGLPQQQEYTVAELKCYIPIEDKESGDILVQLLEYFELVHR
jgi:hypothetical protein